MPRYIDADALLADLDIFAEDKQWRSKRTLRERWLRNQGIEIFRMGVKAFPTADVAPVVHGRWEEKEDGFGDVYYDCSVCRESFCLIDGMPTDNLYIYCPNCGAKMDLEVME